MAADKLRLQVLLDGIDKLSKPLRAVRGNSQETAKALKLARDQIRELKSAQGDIDAVRQLSDTLQQTSNQLAAARQRTRQLADQLSATANPSKQLRDQYVASRRELKALETQQAHHNQQLTEAQQRLKAAGVTAGSMASRHRELGQAIADANRQIDAHEKHLTSLSRVQKLNKQHAADMQRLMMRGGAGLAIAAGAKGTLTNVLAPPVQAFADLEDARAQLKVAMMERGGQVGPEFEQIAALATRLGDRLPGTTADFVSMMTMLKRQGMSAKAILGGLGEATAYIGVQLKLPAEQAAEFAAKMQDATSTAEKDMMGLMDTIQRMSGIGVETGNMLEAYKALGPAMDMIKRKGLDGANALAPFVVMMDQAGMRGESAGNAIRQIVAASFATDDIKKATDDLAKAKGIKLNLDFTDGKGEFGGLGKMMSELQKLKGLNTETRVALIEDIFGTDSQTSQVLAKVIAQGQGGYDEVVRKLQAQAELQQRVNVQLGTLRNLWEAATGTFTNGLAVIGEAISPELKALVTWFGDLSQRLGTLAKQHPGVVRGIALLAAGIAVLAAAMGGIMMGWAAVSGIVLLAKFSFLKLFMAIKPLGPLLLMVGKAILFIGRALLMTPIGLAATAIAAAAYLIWKNWDTLGPKFEALKQLIQTKWTELAAWFCRLPATFQEYGAQILKGLAAGITGALGTVKAAITGAGAQTISWFKQTLGIHSPSRVFAQLGGFTMAGLAQGIAGGQQGPLAAVMGVGKRLAQAGAMAVGAAAAPAMAIDNAPPLASGQRHVVVQGDTITISISGAGGGQGASIAQEIERILDERDRRKAVRLRSALYDRE